MLPFEITIDFSWVELAEKSFFELMWFFFIHGGWILFLISFIYGGLKLWLYWRQGLFAAKQNYIFLAVDIPRQNLQSPKAVENMFATLAGAHTPIEWHEKWFKGEFQLWFSFEIVSIEGHIQYVIRTPIHYRELVESAVYAQYPDAEIVEVEDYTQAMDIKFPSDEYNLWGADLDLYAPDYLPIRTYPEFEHPMSREIKDPLAAVLEVMSALGPGEHLWFQILAAPADLGWEKKGKKRIDEILGRKAPAKKHFLEKIVESPVKALTMISDQVLPKMEVGKKEEKKEAALPFLPPTEEAEIKAIQRKISKIGYNCKLRFIYLGKREVFRKGLGVSGGFGAWKQFSVIGGNGFKPGKNKTKVVLLKKWRLPRRQNRILEVFKKRFPDTGKGPYILNIEELASLYHFPYVEVKVPLVKKIESKKAAAPIGLPVEETTAPVTKEVVEKEVAEEKEKVKEQQPEKIERMPVIDYDDDFFETRFAKDKTFKSDQERKKQIIKKIKQQNIKEQKTE